MNDTTKIGKSYWRLAQCLTQQLLSEYQVNKWEEERKRGSKGGKEREARRNLSILTGKHTQFVKISFVILSALRHIENAYHSSHTAFGLLVNKTINTND